ncbi:MAG: cell surface protein [Muribaculum sp.]|nr:cell surface protein [Muribaculum sp.]
MKVLKIYLPIIAIVSCLSACDGNDIPMVNLGIDDVYYIPRMHKLFLSPSLTGEAYRWEVTASDGKVIDLSTDKDYIFLAEGEGTYSVTFDIIDTSTPFHFTTTVNVMHEEVEYSPYISTVYEYCPAPGQFINEMPKYEDGDTYADILQKAEESISGTNDILISLGGFGGYVTFGFDHTVINRPGEADFRIWGNCFYELTDPSRKGGSAEPGIVMVSYDTNGNGLPDDEWYELAGSDYSNPSTRHGYSITYHAPDPNREIVGDEDGNLNDLHYIKWIDSSGATGYMPKNIFHSQDYYPKWVEEKSITLQGTCLPENGIDVSGYGSYYILYSFGWGYVDNHPNDYADLNSFNIDHAVDSRGNHVDLPGADFIRVYTGVNQYCGWLGETSTELCRAQDLHIDLLAPFIP